MFSDVSALASLLTHSEAEEVRTLTSSGRRTTTRFDRSQCMNLIFIG